MRNPATHASDAPSGRTSVTRALRSGARAFLGSRARRRTRIALAGALALAAGVFGCRDIQGPPSGGGARLSVASDPPGARILLDGRNTNQRTPDTISGLHRRHDVAVRLDTLGVAYGFLAQVEADFDVVQSILGPLVMRCPTNLCWEGNHRLHTVNRMRIASNPVGTLFMRAGVGDGIVWPANTRNSYVSGAVPVFAGVTGTRDTVALGIYDQRYLAGRPVPTVVANGDRFELRQSTWLLPPVEALTLRTVRAIEIDQHLLAVQPYDDAVLIRLTFRNISHNPAYGAADPIVPGGGVHYSDVFIGFAMDPDIGRPQNDWVSYEPGLAMVFAYSANMREADDRGFEGEWRTAPGLVGLRVLDAPPGTRVVLNAWMHGSTASPGDWRAGYANERAGWGMLSGLQPYAPSHADPRVGHLPQAPGDARIAVSAGPLELAPGDSASIVVAVVIASPVPDTFVSGTQVPPGDPANPARQVAQMAGALFERAAALDAVTAIFSAPGPPQ